MTMVHFKGKAGLLADDEGDVALVIIEMGFKTSDGVAFG